MTVQRKKYAHKPSAPRVRRVLRHMKNAEAALDVLIASPMMGEEDRVYARKIQREQESLGDALKRNLIDRYAT